MTSHGHWRAAAGLLSLWLLAGRGATAVAQQAEWSAQRWEQTVYYRFTFAATAADSGRLRVTAADEYELFFNGSQVGADADLATVEEYPVALQSGANHIAVGVANRDRGSGNGLLVEVVAGDQRWISTPSGLNEVWLWSAEAPQGTAWLTAELSRDPKWRPVQQGSLDRSRIAAGDSLVAEVIAGFPGDVEVGAPDGGIRLRSVRGENLALGKPANRPEVFDSRPATIWTINPSDLNSTASVDLLQRRLVSGVRVLTAGKTATEFTENTMRGYAVQVSNDGFQWSEVGVIHGISRFDQSGVFFRPLFARQLRVVVAEVDPLRRSRVAEIQVFGEGISPAGTFLSEALDLGVGGRKNFGRVRWEADLPEGTQVSLQFRSADSADRWSPWSAPVRRTGVELAVPEPRALLQYRVDLSTQFEDATPQFRLLAVEHSQEIPVSRARGRVQPNAAVLGQDTLFTYTLDLEFDSGDLGVERLRIATPSRVELESVDLPPDVQLASSTALGDSLELVFASPLRTSGSVSASFRARLLTNQFAFASQLLAPGAAPSLNAEEDTTADAATGVARSWQVRATDVTGPLLGEVQANPPVLTPNGDGINDGTVIELTLARVSEPQEVEIRILSLDGRAVRDLQLDRLSGGQYLRPPQGRDPARSPTFWDGRDDSGNLVPPGLYLVRARARLGRGDQTRLRAIAVVY